MRIELPQPSFAIEKNRTCTRGTHKVWASNKLYFENASTRYTDEEALNLYQQYEAIRNATSNNGWRLSYDEINGRRTLFRAGHGFIIETRLEAVSCYGERTEILYFKDSDVSSDDVKNAKETLANISYENTRMPMNITRKKMKPKHKNSMVFNAPLIGDAEPFDASKVRLPLVKQAFPCLLADYIKPVKLKGL